MKTRVIALIILVGCLGLVAVIGWWLRSGPRNPSASLQVVDGVGKPVAGAIIHPEGLRPKPGPYASGWYNWKTANSQVPDSPVVTDSQGRAKLPYPKYVFERIETGTLCLSVEHPDYAPARPECRIALEPPASAPWRAWFDYISDRIRHRVLTIGTQPIVLKQGSVLILSVKPGTGPSQGPPLRAQISSLSVDTKNFWLRPSPNVLITRRLTPGQATLRAIQFNTNGSVWFSDVTSITAVGGQTNEVTVELKPGCSVHGHLDETVSRPIHDGRIIANIWPRNEPPANSPPQWHAWTNIEPDGSFVLSSLPEGDLELVALCDGFVSTNGPGKFHLHYPQKYSLEAKGLDVIIGMEPTACLEVNVRDDQDKPLAGARVSTWPNVRYGEWSATIIGEDCYNIADWLKDTDNEESLNNWRHSRPIRFAATTDLSGLAIIRNLPSEADAFMVDHERLSLPAIDTGFGQKRRQSVMVLQPGWTNQITVRLEPKAQSQITHY